MFTGLTQDLGSLQSRDETADGAKLSISTGLGADLSPGDSVAVDGVCLTAVEVDDSGFVTEVMNITLGRSTLGDLEPADPVNLEPAARVGDRLGGHIVQGHVDGVGEVASVESDGFARRIAIDLPAELARYVVERGSVTVNGVSLTVAAVAGGRFVVSLIPETLQRTNLSRLEAGSRVNVECDVIARYVERLLAANDAVAPGDAGNDAAASGDDPR